MKSTSRSIIGKRVGPSVIPARNTIYDVLIDGRWYTQEFPSPSITPSISQSTIVVSPSVTPSVVESPSVTPTPTPSPVLAWTFQYTYINPTIQNYFNGPVTIEVRAFNGLAPVSLVGKTIIWASNPEGAASFSNPTSNGDFGSQILLTPSGDGGASASIDGIIDNQNDIAFYL